MRRAKIIYFLLIISLFLNSIFLFIFTFSTPVKAVEESRKFEGVMLCEDEDTWNDEAWQFYMIIVDVGDKVYVDLEYEGDLDLDLRLYWKRDNPLGFHGFDVTHCNIDHTNTYVYTENSQLRTDDTSDLGEKEEIIISNPSYTEEADQTAYILVFTHEGEGDSEYTLRGSKELTEINDNDVYDCNFILIILLIYLAVAATIVGLFTQIILRRRKKIRKKREEEDARVALEKKAPKDLKHIDLDTKVEVTSKKKKKD